MKTDEMGNAMGRPSWGSSFVDDPGAKVFVENEAHAQNKKKTLKDQEQSARSFYSCFSSLAEPGLQRPAAVKGAPLFWRGVSETLTARTAAKESPREERPDSQGSKISVTRSTYDE
jgi:hypothetical protein